MNCQEFQKQKKVVLTISGFLNLISLLVWLSHDP